MEGNSFSFAFNARPCKPENNCVCLEPSYKSACWTYSTSNVFNAATADDDDDTVVAHTFLAPPLTKAFFGNCVVVFLKQHPRRVGVDAIDVSAFISSFVRLLSTTTRDDVPQILLLNEEERERVCVCDSLKRENERRRCLKRTTKRSALKLFRSSRVVLFVRSFRGKRFEISVLMRKKKEFN